MRSTSVGKQILDIVINSNWWLETRTKNPAGTISHGLIPSKGKLLANKNLHASSPLLDQVGCINVGGQLQLVQIGYFKKYPSFLIGPPVVVWIWTCKVIAPWTPVTFNFDKESFSSKMTQKCRRCFRAKPVPLVKLMGDSPEERVRPSSLILRFWHRICWTIYD